MTTELSETILSNLGGIEHNNLITILDIDTNEIIQMPPSLYFEVDELKTLKNTTDANKQLSILSMNIQSIHAKFRNWKYLLKPCKTLILNLILYAYKNVGYPNRPIIIIYSYLVTTVLSRGEAVVPVED